MSEPPRVVGEPLLHAVPLAAIALLLLNDHVLKSAFPGVVTGKLSDFAGLCFFPLLLQSVVELVARRRASSRAVVACVAATIVVFTLVKTWAPATRAFAWSLGALQSPVRGALRPVRVARDPSDLVALPMALVPLLLDRKRRRGTANAAGGTRPPAARTNHFT